MPGQGATVVGPMLRLCVPVGDGYSSRQIWMALHEHFGQTIAYARMNGITPPWTEEAQRKAKAAKDGAGPK